MSLAACGGGHGVDRASPIRPDAAEIVDRQPVVINPQVNDAERFPDEHRDAIPDELVWALAGTDSNQRLDAIDSLAQIDNEAVVGLLQLASLDASADVRSSVVDALAEIGTEGATLSLTFALSDPDPTVREDAVLALAEIGSATAMNLLYQALADEDPEIRHLAAEAIAESSG